MGKFNFTIILATFAICFCAIMTIDIIWRNNLLNSVFRLANNENVENTASKENIPQNKNTETVKMDFGTVLVHHVVETVRVVQYDMMQPISEEQKKIECVYMKNTQPSHYICLNAHDWFSDNIKTNLAYWETAIQNFIKSFFVKHTDAMFLDVGMNIGLMSMLVAASNENAQILAVEPSTKCVNSAHKAAHLNKFQNRFTMVIAAISSKRTEVSMVGEFAMMKIDRNLKQNETNKAYKIDAITLNDLVPLIKRKKALMKMDIEGSECHAFANADKLFDAIDIPAVVMEVGVTFREGNCCMDMMLKFFSDRNYEAYYFSDHPQHKTPLDFSKWPNWDYNYGNVYFQRK